MTNRVAQSPPGHEVEPAFHPDTVHAATLLTLDDGPVGRFYADVLGLAEHSRDATESVWRSRQSAGTPDTHGVILRLMTDAAARVRPPGTTGLYHVAFLLPDRPAFAAAARALLAWSSQDPAVRFHGYAEHGVSEAVYGTDPDGNGIELTLDHPIASWPRPDGANDRVTNQHH